MSNFTGISILLLATVTSVLLVDIPTGAISDRTAGAVRLRDGRTYFDRPPTLVDAETTVNSVYAWGATYYFNLRLPENAGEPLQRVTISQYEGTDKIAFDRNESLALAIAPSGERTRLNAAIAITDTEPQQVTVDFTPPIPPGSTISIGLRPYNNPRYGGVYLFGVTAFPLGEKPHGQFLGYARLHFYDRSDRSGIFRR
ncbi:DUF2808 domain-containing protein [Pseudanabaena sp. PCC 6802]|uniref:DUF2808 domain-containing protein n=1 Tax=Pseudanabaena sp. PCC 6802 TaxID=118173 RepID=UPI00034A09BE|nr:DUF2808 domain-containing protein [Pseudanabaena sp. PCC 6802]